MTGPVLDREEYVEQAYFFHALAERMEENSPIQETLQSIREELLATTKLPLAIDFMLAELRHQGVIAPAMRRLAHYFSPFQTYVVEQAENEGGRFDMRIALQLLRREAEYRGRDADPQGIFLYQFEAICRNRLGYDEGLTAMAADGIYDEAWRMWIFKIRRQVGAVDLADLIYVRSAYYEIVQERRGKEAPPTSEPVLFGEREGRIALANRRKDPLLLFAAMQRHLDYPAVPLSKKPDQTQQILPQLMVRMDRLETRVKLLEEEQRGGIDLSKFFERPEAKQPPDRPDRR